MIAMAKQATTMPDQANLPNRDFAVEMCASPWIVQFSRNSLRKVIDMVEHLEGAMLGDSCFCNLAVYHLIPIDGMQAHNTFC